MKYKLRSLLALLALVPAALAAQDKPADKSKNCGCACCKGKEVCCCHAAQASSEKAADAKRYPLKGVIRDILADQSALLVKHEDIPGFMPAMTMSFKVDAATLKAVAKDQRLTATLVQRGEEFWLEDVKPITTP
jgi:Cu/Ag efflux protein CusF